MPASPTPKPPPPTAAAVTAARARSAAAGKATEPRQHWMRQLFDELFFVFAIVMFFKLFLVDMYKIPSGSMTPTLIGGMIADVDIDQDGKKDIAYWLNERGDDQTLAFLRQPDGTFASPAPPSAIAPQQLDPRFINPEAARQWRMAHLPYNRFDRILVNKLAYWFKHPARGQIVVFKVPPSIWAAKAPIYIKRLAGEPGDTLTFDPRGRLIANGKLVETPKFYKTQYYSERVQFSQPGAREFPTNTYEEAPEYPGTQHILSVHVPAGQAYVFGDNTLGSFDSRYWGGVDLDNFKGRAFFRVLPLSALGFLH